MRVVEDFVKDLQNRIIKAKNGECLKPTIIFCGCSHQVKKDMHKLAKRIGFKPLYSIKNPTLRVELKNRNYRTKIINKYKTTIIGYEDFEYLVEYLEKTNSIKK